MSSKITIVGQLRYSETEGLQGSVSISVGKPPRQQIVWLEVLPNADEWPGIPQSNDKDAYANGLHAEPSYKEAAKEFFKRQRHNPQRIPWGNFWGYKDKIFAFHVGRTWN